MYKPPEINTVSFSQGINFKIGDYYLLPQSLIPNKSYKNIHEN